MGAESTLLVRFYARRAPDDRGRFLEDIQGWSDLQLERTHDYIQWLFPLTKRSAFNPSAPILDAKAISEFLSRPKLRANFRASLVRMLAFYGLELVGDRPLRIVPSASFSEQAENWLTPLNHNHLRITRILESLMLLGLEEEAAAFFGCLEGLYGKESARVEPRISEETFHFWRMAAAGS
jgi:hypothetical protein